MAAALAALFTSTAAAAPVAATAATAAATITQTAGALGGAAAGAGATGGLMSLFSNIGWADLLQGGFSLLSMSGDIIGGNMQAAALEEQAAYAELEGRQELLRGRQEAVVQKRNLNAAMAQIAAAGRASGLAGEGSIEAAQRVARQDADFDLGLTRDDAAMRAASKRAQAQQYRRSAGTALSGGVFSGLGRLANYGLSRVQRG